MFYSYYLLLMIYTHFFFFIKKVKSELRLGRASCSYKIVLVKKKRVMFILQEILLSLRLKKI